MRIGVVSDTHNNLRNVSAIVSLFNAAGVDQVVHTGDITQAKTLEVFARLDAPLCGVFGNNDLEVEALGAAIDKYGFRFVQPPLELVWADRRIVVVHDPLEFDQVRLSDFDLALHGHTHRETIEFEPTHLRFNPGECAGMMKGFNAVGIVDLISLAPEVLRF